MRIHNRNQKYKKPRTTQYTSDFKRVEEPAHQRTGSFCCALEPADKHDVQWHNVMGSFDNDLYWREVSRKVEVG